jgi:hypothetical protein
MNILKTFTELLKPNNTNQTNTPEGFCPPCWGRQEYGGEFYDAVFKENINLNNISSKEGWINAYVKQNFEGIRLTETNGAKECPSCALAYKAPN